MGEKPTPSFPVIRDALAGRNFRAFARVLAAAVGLSIYFFAVYNTCNWITAHRSDINQAGFSWERHIPFVPFMIIPYMSIDLLFFAALFVCRSRQERIDHARRILLAITVAGICFLLFPLKMTLVRPVPQGIFAGVFKFLYGFDRPYNLAPSLHIALRTLLWVVYVPKTRGLVRWAIKGWLILIGISTLLTYQHQVMDLVTGQFLALCCLATFPEARFRADYFPGVRERRIGFRYAGTAVMLWVAGYVLRPWGLLLLWPATSLGIIAWAYLGAGAAVFRKWNGRLPLSTLIVLGPYLIGVQMAGYLHRLRGPAYAEVTSGILIGRRLTSREGIRLVQSSVRSVLDLTAESSETIPLHEVTYRNVPMLDLACPARNQLADAVAFLRGQGGLGKIYVHCAWGYSRSAVVVAAYLLATGDANTVDEAISKVAMRRAGIVIDETMLRLLRDFQIRLQMNRDPAPEGDFMAEGEIAPQHLAIIEKSSIAAARSVFISRGYRARD